MLEEYIVHLHMNETLKWICRVVMQMLAASGKEKNDVISASTESHFLEK